MAKESNPSFEFVKDYLTKNPGAAYADVRDAAARAGHTIYPIVYGRAQSLLGLAGGKGGKKGSKAKAKTGTAKRGRPRKVAVAPDAPRPKRGRPPKAARAAAASIGGELGSVLEAVRSMQADRDRLRKALADIRDLIDAAI